jgi:hypothetical protein
VQTEDNGDGTYGAEFELTQPGRWDACVAMDGSPADPAHAVSFFAQPGSVGATECLVQVRGLSHSAASLLSVTAQAECEWLRGVQRDESRGPRMEEYQADTFYVGTHDEARLFTGHELALLHVHAPSGGETIEALQFDQPSQVRTRPPHLRYPLAPRLPPTWGGWQRPLIQ